MTEKQFAEFALYEATWVRLFKALPKDTQETILANPMGEQAEKLATLTSEQMDLEVA